MPGIFKLPDPFPCPLSVNKRLPGTYLATYYNTPAGGTNYYYMRVIQADREMAWASPVWVTK